MGPAPRLGPRGPQGRDLTLTLPSRGCSLLRRLLSALWPNFQSYATNFHSVHQAGGPPAKEATNNFNFGFSTASFNQQDRYTKQRIIRLSGKQQRTETLKNVSFATRIALHSQEFSRFGGGHFSGEVRRAKKTCASLLRNQPTFQGGRLEVSPFRLVGTTYHPRFWGAPRPPRTPKIDRKIR